jgi:Ca2+-binding EF-hand superfamily protein
MKITKTHSRIIACALSLFVLPVAFAKDADKKHAKMDADGDGLVSRAEHTAGVQRMFAEMDTNQDGAVTAVELDAKKDKHGDKRRDEMSATEVISMSDQNADGRLTAAEYTTSADSKFDKMDTNRDGSLSKDELEAGHKAKKSKRDS